MSALITGPKKITFQPTLWLLGIGFVALHFTLMLGSLAALAFVLACIALVVRQPALILSEIADNWLLWLLVGWCLLTVLWSNVPSLSLRHAIQLGFTFAIAVAAASRLSVTSVLQAILIGCLVVGLASLLAGRVNHAGLWIGIFGSKNALAQFATLAVIAPVAMLIGARRTNVWTSISLVVLALGMLLLARAGSLGANFASAIAGMGMLSLWALRRLTGWQKTFLGLLMVLAALLIVLIIAGYFNELSSLFLEKTGKDFTLTGRTDLWSAAFVEISRHPVLGQGYKAFWVPGNPVAEEMWEMFGIASKTGFHFHNTFISNAVEIGLTGVLMQLVLFFGGFIAVVRWALDDPCAESLFLFGVMFRQFVLMNSEVVFFNHFHPMTLLTVMVIVFSKRIGRDRKRSHFAKTQKYGSRQRPGAFRPVYWPAVPRMR